MSKVIKEENKMSNSYFKPAVLVEDSNGIHQINSKSLLLKNRVIFLDETVTGDSVNETIRQIVLMGLSSKDPITIIIDSPGGSIQAGFQLIDVMEASPCVIRTIALGSACSMGAVILAAGTPGHRAISARSKVMIHEPLISGGVGGSTSQIESIANNLKERRETINKMLCKYTRQSMKVMKKATSFDHWYDANEALEFGLVDTIAAEADLFTMISGGN